MYDAEILVRILSAGENEHKIIRIFLNEHEIIRIFLNPVRPGGGQICPPHVIFFDNFLTTVFFDPNSSRVFLKTSNTRFKTHFE